MSQLAPVLAFGAHPDDIEFGCGAVIATEARMGRACHFVICSRGEAASNGTPAARMREAKTGGKILGASVEFVELAGDARLKPRTEFAQKLAMIIRKVRPGILLAPTLVRNQHPDHVALGRLVQTAARLARYGGIRELKKLPAHAVDALLYYAVTPDAEPHDVQPILMDVSEPAVMSAWTKSMEAHASQMKTRNYLEMQLLRARLNGLRAGVGHAVPLFPNDPLVFDSFALIQRSARVF